MQSLFVIITKLIASKNYFCKFFFCKNFGRDGAMWQIGVLAGKPCTFLVQNGSLSAFWHYKKKETLSRALNLKWHIPSTCLDVSESGFLLEFTA